MSSGYQDDHLPGYDSDGLIEGVAFTPTNDLRNSSSRLGNEVTNVVMKTTGPNSTRLPKESSPTVDEVYTVEDAVESIGFGPFQILATIFAGMCWLTEAMEVMLLAVLSPIIKCEWDLAPWEQAMLTSVVFVGFLFGGLTWGFLADAFGRRTILLFTVCNVLLFGLLSAISPNFVTLLLLRFITGFFIIGGTQAVTYYVEFLPRKTRGICIVLLEVWWAVGSIFSALLALAVVPNLPDPLNWRLYLGLCASTVPIVLVFFLFMPESARYYVSKGKNEKGEKVLQRVAWYNGKKLLPGRLVSQEEKERLEKKANEEVYTESSLIDHDATSALGNELEQERRNGEEEEPLLSDDDSSPTNTPTPQTVGSRFSPQKIKANIANGFRQFGRNLLALLKNKMWKTTLPLVLIWVGCAWLYYGAVLLTTTVLEHGYDPRCGESNNTEVVEQCGNLTSSFYVKIVWTSAAEFPGIIVTLIIIELIGRKITMVAEFICTGVCFGLLLICVPEVYLALFLFGARGFATGVFQAVYVYTPEVYSTKIRGSALGLMSSAARIGGLITPFIAQTLYHVHDIVTILLYVGSCLVLAVLALLLPIETKGRSLKDEQ